MRKEHVFMLFVVAAVGLMVFMPHLALASTSSGTEFSTLYTKLTGWVNGLPGIMGAIALMVGGIYISFIGQKSPMYFFYSALGAAAIFLIPTIATALGGAVW